jgi:hypothetical protein
MNRHRQRQQTNEQNSACYLNSKTNETIIKRKADLFEKSLNIKSMRFNSSRTKTNNHYEYKINSNLNSIGSINKHILFENCEFKYDNYEKKKNENNNKFIRDYDEDEYASEHNTTEELNFEQFELFISGHKIELPKVIFGLF